MRSGILQVGDLIGCDGHIAIIAGFDENNIYIAEALGKGIVMEVRERYREVWQCGDYTYAMLMGDIYAKHNGKGNVTEMWKDYSAENNQCFGEIYENEDSNIYRAFPHPVSVLYSTFVN